MAQLLESVVLAAGVSVASEVTPTLRAVSAIAMVAVVSDKPIGFCELGFVCQCTQIDIKKNYKILHSCADKLLNKIY